MVGIDWGRNSVFVAIEKIIITSEIGEPNRWSILIIFICIHVLYNEYKSISNLLYQINRGKVSRTVKEKRENILSLSQLAFLPLIYSHHKDLPHFVANRD